jgi:hypothetical protein
MKKTYLIYILLLLIGSVKTLPTLAQYRNNNWAFGDSCGMRFNSAGIDSFYTTSLKARGACASISDSLGNLLFYASTPKLSFWQAGIYAQGVVYNKNHQEMENGDSLLTTLGSNELLIVPFPSHQNQFIIFTCGTTNLNSGLKYSIVDLNYNNGLGKVIQKNIYLDTSTICDGMVAIQHGNGQDWWLLYRRFNNSNQFLKILINDQGVQPITQQLIGAIFNTNVYRMSVNPAGDKIAGASTTGLVELFDFDRCNGTLSNYKGIQTIQANPLDTTAWFWGIEFSASGRYLYLSTAYLSVYLYQLDLNILPTNLIYSSKTVLDYQSYPINAGSYLKLGPDNRIYRATWWYDGLNYPYPYPDTTYNMYNTNLSVINSPDSAGLACDYQAYSVHLPTCRTYIGLPNNPDYELGKLAGSPCDTLSVGISETIEDASELFVYYASDWQKAFINAKGLQGKKYNLQVFDLSGKLIYQQQGNTESGYFTKDLPMEGLASGIYIVNLQTEREKLSKKFVKASN